jgi:X-X-X-Leu-X-X-Gly heptad repeat protein
MKLFKKVLAVTVMVLSVLLIILFVAGIVGNWIANNSLTTGIVRALTGVDTVLAGTEHALAGLDTAVGNTRDRVDGFDETVAAAGATFVENPVILIAISERLDLGISPAIEEVRGTVQAIRETALAAQNTIQTLNALPFISIGGSVAEESKLQKLSDGVANLTEGVQEIQGGVREAKAGVTADAVSVFDRGMSRLDAGLADIETAVSGYGDQVSALRARVSELKSALALWLDVASVIITLLLLWLILAHVITFVFGLSLLKGENLFAHLLRGPEQQPPV